ncbi:LMBR1 domain-containing protein 2 homolog [Artemia franciscana]|uniref:Uncharacterized protein n=1 Tax=Artemia franciscana TaxID=6661 RepID=A0AA88IB07_ARTSF|nr:hypothetical protein QYM36_001298 [Artemia franciscana]KAK2724758.1 hypothetical protein QYM36_001298 [Artemia franciscana]
MNLAPLLTEVVITFLAVASLLYRYGNWYRHHIIVTIAVLLAWYFSFLIAFILPLDVTSTVYRQCLLESNYTSGTLNRTEDGSLIVANNTSGVGKECHEPWSYVPDTVFPTFWRVVYWTSQFLTWLVLPLMQSYTRAGDFTVKGKLRSALIDNVIYYGSYLTIALILLVYLLFKNEIELDFWKLKVIASSASNTWGLFWLVLLLGYGLVDTPRCLFRASNYVYQLRYSYFKAAKLYAEKTEAEENLEDVIQSLRGVSSAVSNTSPLRPCVETIEMKIPLEFHEKFKRRIRTTDINEIPNEKSLAKLHKQVIKAVHVYKRTETQWDTIVSKIKDFEDVAKNRDSNDRRFHSSSQEQRGEVWNRLNSPKLEWYWKCMMRRHFYRALGVILTVFSVTVVWSELTFFVKEPTLSIFAAFVDAAKENYNFLTIELLSISTILYLCICAYRTLFKVRVLNFYYLADNHHTDEYSLIFSGMMLCRLTPPMCLNFLGLIHMDSHVIKTPILETHYTQIMGHMDVLPLLADGFYIYFPMAITALCAATYFSLGAKILNIIGFQQFVGDENITSDLVEEGQELIKRERRKLDTPSERQPSTSMRRIESLSSRYRDSPVPVTEEESDPLRQSLLRPDPEATVEDEDKLLERMFLGDRSVSYSSTDLKTSSRTTKNRFNLFDDV